MSCCAVESATTSPTLPPKIQIVVSRIGSHTVGRGGHSGGGDSVGFKSLRLPSTKTAAVQFEPMAATKPTRGSTVSHSDGHGPKGKNKLPPLNLPGDGSREGQTRGRLLSPGYSSTFQRRRSPSPFGGSEKLLTSSGRRSPLPTVGISLPPSPLQGSRGHGGNRGSPTTSRYHHACFPSQTSCLTSFIASPIRHGSFSSSVSSTGSPRFSHSSSSSPLQSPFQGLKVTDSPATATTIITASTRPGSASTAKMKPLDPDKVEQYLRENPKFLANYVKQHVDADTLGQWVSERNHGALTRRQSLSRWKFGNESEKFNLFKTLASQVRRSHSESGVLWELSVCISSAVSANAFVLYLLDSEINKLRRFSPQKEKQVSEPLALDGSTLATYVCRGREPIRITREEAIARFPNGLGDQNENSKSHYILCHPIVKSDGEIIGVLELHRETGETQFYKEDEEIVHSYLVWGGIALHYADLNSVMNKQKKLNEFLLGVVRSIFQDMISMDAVIKKVMNFAQRLVDADRASLFLVDSRTKELYARIFDMGSEKENAGSEFAIDGSVKEIRFPMGTGIAGLVATSGQILNIHDAYKDERFNRGVDQVTGYVTKSILCMPVFIRSTIIGVVQMVNKRRGLFTKDDEDAFEMFAVYCGLALHHAKLYDKIRRSEQKYRVALDVLSYHNSCSEDEFETARAMGVPKSIPGLDDFYFKPNSVDGMQKVHYSVYQFVELFGLTRFDLDSVYRFILTVKKNYRAVPYHNWSHGFTVAHCMFCILKKSSVFRPLECLALYVACLCHDLDHRGMNNKFMLESASPLASIYSTSTMEHHHFNQTVTILQQEGHNIFAKLGSEEYKQVLGNIKHCILATDLALFFSNKARLDRLLENDSFSWAVLEHRLIAQAVAMTASDLCASSKPWDIQIETVKVIFEEFYNQGDLEKKFGRKPIPMMDRDCADELPASQVGFIAGICIPCYDVLKKLIPSTVPLLKGCQVNMARWRELDEEQKLKNKKT